MRKTGGEGFLFFILFFLSLAGCRSDKGDGNHAPVITSLPLTLAYAAEEYLYDVEAKDKDKDLLTYKLISSPEGMTINSSTGAISWLPTLREVGNHWIEVRVSDDKASASQSFTIRVSPLDNGVPFQRGFNLVSWQADAYLKPQAAGSLNRLRANGCEWVSILVTWYQDTLRSTTIYRWDPVTPSDEAVVRAITTAQSLGMKVVLKPHVDPRTGEWRGDIGFSEEADWQAWFQSYNNFLGHYLELAEAHQVDAVVIGTELKGTEGREDDWRRTIALARSRFSGLLSYNANHDSFFLVSWWDDLDYIGISAYFQLTESNSPTVAELNAAWEERIRVLAAFAAFMNKDIVFTELGYASRDGTNIDPWSFNPNSPPDVQEQADCYQAGLESLYDEWWFKGMFWWAWSWDPSIDDNGFDIAGKPAEDILRYWYAGY
jgi:hypothetical protein